MNLKFDEKRTTQAVALLLKLRGGKMSYLKLMKLLYFIERESLIRWGRPFTFDNPVSMDQGTVLSNTLNLIKEETPPDQHTYWKTFISSPSAHEISLLAEPERDELSNKDIELINEIYSQYGRFDRWKLRDISHSLPEWKNPHGTSLPIDYADILKSAHKPEEQIVKILDEIQGLAFMDNYFSA
jgi:uncharacterized phage-associated protein